MSDIVERLRDQGRDAFAKHYSLGMFKLCDEAAAEITRLRAELEAKSQQEQWQPIEKNGVVTLPQFPEGRPETGPMQFGNDWPGVFIRGDNALFAAMSIAGAVVKLREDAWMERSTLTNLIQTLRSCSVGNTGWPPAPPTANETASDA